MSKKPQTLYISLIPVIVMLLLILGAGYFLLKDEFKLSKIFNREPQVRRLEGFPTVVSPTTQTEKQRVIIKSQDELNNFLKVVDPSGNLALGEKINFDREYLLGVSSNSTNETDRSIKVRKLYENKNDKELLVSVNTEEPNEKCTIIGDLNTPVDLVAISKTDYNIKFEVVKHEVSDCEQSTQSNQ